MIRALIALPFYVLALIGIGIAMTAGYIAFVIEGLE